MLRQTLNELLGQALDEARGLAETLEAEREALDGRDAERITELATTKNQRIAALERLEQRRQEALRAAGYGDDPGGMEQALAACGDQALAERWQTLITTVERCQQRNRENGIVLDDNRRRAQEALNLLRGEPATDGLYDPTGQTDGGSGSRSIDRA